MGKLLTYKKQALGGKISNAIGMPEQGTDPKQGISNSPEDTSLSGSTGTSLYSKFKPKVSSKIGSLPSPMSNQHLLSRASLYGTIRKTKLLGMGGYMSHSGTIHINPENKGKFNATKAATGKSTEELTHSSNPVTKKRAVFAQNASHWKHANGGTLVGAYKKRMFDDGGAIDPNAPNNGLANGIATVTGIGSSILDSNANVNQETGAKSQGAYVGSGALKGAGMGAQIGSIIPGVGTVIGAGLGAVAGTIGGIFTGKEQRAKLLNEAINTNAQEQSSNEQMSGARNAADPSLSKGISNASYFVNGGQLQRSTGKMADYMRSSISLKAMGGGLPAPVVGAITQGGTAISLSSDNAVINGPSHADGGVDMPQINSQLEGGESTVGDFVFSKKLGFAKQAIPLARAKGTIEKKPLTQDRYNALNLLRKKEQELMQAQEGMKQVMNVQ